MEQADDPAQVDERAVILDIRDDPFENRVFFEAFKGFLPESYLLGLQGGTTGQNNISLILLILHDPEIMDGAY